MHTFYNMSKTQRKPTITKHVSQNQNQKPQKTEKQQPSWAVVRGLLACRNVEIQQQQQQQHKETKPQPKPQPAVEAKQPRRKKQEQRKLQEERRVLPEENSKKSKKMKCSGSLCNNTGVMAKPETGTPQKKVSPNNGYKNNEASTTTNRSTTKGPLNELNGAVSASSSSLSASAASSSSSAGGGSFRGMPFRRLSGCYECRMVVDPVLGFTRDPSLRSSICSCPDCGEIMKTENLEHHQAVKHAGISSPRTKDTSSHFKSRF